MRGIEVKLHTAGPVRPAEGEFLGRPLHAWRIDTARELGIPEAECRVGTGHQAELWHCGILAKYLLADELATHAGSAVVHLLVDTDARSPTLLRVPARQGDALVERSHEFVSTRVPLAAGAAPVRVPAGPPDALHWGNAEPALACVGEGSEAIHRALSRHAGAADRAAQAWLAIRDLMGAHAGLWTAVPMDRTPWVRTSQLLRTSIGEALLDRMQADPSSCVRAFNAALSAAPRVARPLRETGTAGVELPIWRIAKDGARHRVGIGELALLRAEGALLAPSALLTGAIARAALSDRLVHGTGAHVYERATEAFVREWLGAELPPFDTATATVRLPFPAAPAPRVTRAAHRDAWFDPALLSATSGGAAKPRVSEPKRALLERIAMSPRRSATRRAAYRALQAHLAAGRTENAHALERIAADAEADRGLAMQASLREDRTWSAALHPPSSLLSLRQALRLPA